MRSRRKEYASDLDLPQNIGSPRYLVFLLRGGIPRMLHNSSLMLWKHWRRSGPLICIVNQLSRGRVIALQDMKDSVAVRTGGIEKQNSIICEEEVGQDRTSRFELDSS